MAVVFKHRAKVLMFNIKPAIYRAGCVIDTLTRPRRGSFAPSTDLAYRGAHDVGMGSESGSKMSCISTHRSGERSEDSKIN